METEEMVHSSLLSLQTVVSVGVFPTIHLPGIHKGGRSNKRGEKKADYLGLSEQSNRYSHSHIQLPGALVQHLFSPEPLKIGKYDRYINFKHPVSLLTLFRSKITKTFYY